MPDREGKPKDISNPLGLSLAERLAKIREHLRQTAGTNTGDTGSSANVRTVPDWIWGPYTPIPDPGPTEARFLKAHPEWPETHPWRILGARDSDNRQRAMCEAIDASEQAALRDLLTEESDRVFREVVDLEIARRHAL